MFKKIIISLIVLLILLIILIFACLINQANILLKNNIAVIVRSVGERTEDKALKRLKDIFGDNNVYLVKNVTPLIEASKETFELGLKTGKKWILVVDSDVFLFEDKIWIFIKKAQKIIKKDKKALCFQGYVFDKFANTPRECGVYLFYSKNLKYKNEYFNLCKDKIRPDSCVRDYIEEKGYRTYQSDDVLGIHDFFQNNRDIVKKIILHCKKNDDEIKNWIKEWEKLAKNDKDFEYAFLGLKIYDSIKDKNFIPDSKQFDEYIKNYNILNSKDELQDNEIDEALKKYNTESIEKSKKRIFGIKIKPLTDTY